MNDALSRMNAVHILVWVSMGFVFVELIVFGIHVNTDENAPTKYVFLGTRFVGLGLSAAMFTLLMIN